MASKSYKLIRTISVAAGSLLQQKLRSFLSVLGVVCGVMAVIAMIAIGEGAREETLRQIEQLGTRNLYIKAVSQTREQAIRAREHLSLGLRPEDGERIRKGAASVEAVALLQELSVTVLAGDAKLMPQVVAVSENYADVLGLTISSGRFITPSDQRHRNLVCVLGDDVAQRLGDRGRIGRYLRMEDQLVKVVGILSRLEPVQGKQAVISVRNYNDMIFIPLETAKAFERKANNREPTGSGAQPLAEIVVRTADTQAVMATGALVSRIMQVAHHNAEDYQIVVPLELLRQAERTQRTLNLVLGTIAAISLLVGGIGIMNIMLATVSERTREIGIRRAVGATRKDIMVQFLAEAVILTGAGGIIGLGCGLAAVMFFSALAGWRTAFTLGGILLPLLLSIGVGIFFGLYPARQAAMVDPMVALRNE